MQGAGHWHITGAAIAGQGRTVETGHRGDALCDEPQTHLLMYTRNLAPQCIERTRGQEASEGSSSGLVSPCLKLTYRKRILPCNSELPARPVAPIWEAKSHVQQCGCSFKSRQGRGARDSWPPAGKHWLEKSHGSTQEAAETQQMGESLGWAKWRGSVASAQAALCASAPQALFLHSTPVLPVHYKTSISSLPTLFPWHLLGSHVLF